MSHRTSKSQTQDKNAPSERKTSSHGQNKGSRNTWIEKLQAKNNEITFKNVRVKLPQNLARRVGERSSPAKENKDASDSEKHSRIPEIKRNSGKSGKHSDNGSSNDKVNGRRNGAYASLSSSTESSISDSDILEVDEDVTPRKNNQRNSRFKNEKRKNDKDSSFESTSNSSSSDSEILKVEERVTPKKNKSSVKKFKFDTSSCDNDSDTRPKSLSREAGVINNDATRKRKNLKLKIPPPDLGNVSSGDSDSIETRTNGVKSDEESKTDMEEDDSDNQRQKSEKRFDKPNKTSKFSGKPNIHKPESKKSEDLLGKLQLSQHAMDEAKQLMKSVVLMSPVRGVKPSQRVNIKKDQYIRDKMQRDSQRKDKNKQKKKTNGDSSDSDFEPETQVVRSRKFKRIKPVIESSSSDNDTESGEIDDKLKRNPKTRPRKHSHSDSNALTDDENIRNPSSQSTVCDDDLSTVCSSQNVETDKMDEDEIDEIRNPSSVSTVCDESDSDQSVSLLSNSTVKEQNATQVKIPQINLKPSSSSSSSSDDNNDDLERDVDDVKNNTETEMKEVNLPGLSVPSKTAKRSHDFTPDKPKLKNIDSRYDKDTETYSVTDYEKEEKLESFSTPSKQKLEHVTGLSVKPVNMESPGKATKHMVNVKPLQTFASDTYTADKKDDKFDEKSDNGVFASKDFGYTQDDDCICIDDSPDEETECIDLTQPVIYIDVDDDDDQENVDDREKGDESVDNRDDNSDDELARFFDIHETDDEDEVEIKQENVDDEVDDPEYRELFGEDDGESDDVDEQMDDEKMAELRKKVDKVNNSNKVSDNYDSDDLFEDDTQVDHEEKDVFLADTQVEVTDRRSDVKGSVNNSEKIKTTGENSKLEPDYNKKLLERFFNDGLNECFSKVVEKVEKRLQENQDYYNAETQVIDITENDEKSEEGEDIYGAQTQVTEKRKAENREDLYSAQTQTAGETDKTSDEDDEMYSAKTQDLYSAQTQVGGEADETSGEDDEMYGAKTQVTSDIRHKPKRDIYDEETQVQDHDISSDKSDNEIYNEATQVDDFGVGNLRRISSNSSSKRFVHSDKDSDDDPYAADTQVDTDLQEDDTYDIQTQIDNSDSSICMVDSDSSPVKRPKTAKNVSDTAISVSDDTDSDAFTKFDGWRPSIDRSVVDPISASIQIDTSEDSSPTKRIADKGQRSDRDMYRDLSDDSDSDNAFSMLTQPDNMSSRAEIERQDSGDDPYQQSTQIDAVDNNILSKFASSMAKSPAKPDRQTSVHSDKTGSANSMRRLSSDLTKRAVPIIAPQRMKTTQEKRESFRLEKERFYSKQTSLSSDSKKSPSSSSKNLPKSTERLSSSSVNNNSKVKKRHSSGSGPQQKSKRTKVNEEPISMTQQLSRAREEMERRMYKTASAPTAIAKQKKQQQQQTSDDADRSDVALPNEEEIIKKGLPVLLSPQKRPRPKDAYDLDRSNATTTSLETDKQGDSGKSNESSKCSDKDKEQVDKEKNKGHSGVKWDMTKTKDFKSKEKDRKDTQTKDKMSSSPDKNENLEKESDRRKDSSYRKDVRDSERREKNYSNKTSTSEKKSDGQRESERKDNYRDKASTSDRKSDGQRDSDRRDKNHRDKASTSDRKSDGQRDSDRRDKDYRDKASTSDRKSDGQRDIDRRDKNRRDNASTSYRKSDGRDSERKDKDYRDKANTSDRKNDGQQDSERRDKDYRDKESTSERKSVERDNSGQNDRHKIRESKDSYSDRKSDTSKSSRERSESSSSSKSNHRSDSDRHRLEKEKEKKRHDIGNETENDKSKKDSEREKNKNDSEKEKNKVSNEKGKQYKESDNKESDKEKSKQDSEKERQYKGSEQENNKHSEKRKDKNESEKEKDKKDSEKRKDRNESERDKKESEKKKAETEKKQDGKGEKRKEESEKRKREIDSEERPALAQPESVENYSKDTRVVNSVKDNSESNTKSNLKANNKRPQSKSVTFNLVPDVTEFTPDSGEDESSSTGRTNTQASNPKTISYDAYKIRQALGSKGATPMVPASGPRRTTSVVPGRQNNEPFKRNNENLQQRYSGRPNLMEKNAVQPTASHSGKENRLQPFVSPNDQASGSGAGRYQPQFQTGSHGNIYADLQQKFGAYNYVDYFKYRLLHWNPLWLYEHVPDSGVIPPIIEKDDLQLNFIPQNFNSFSDYYKILVPHLLHEVWETCYRDWKEIRAQKRKLSQKFVINVEQAHPACPEMIFYVLDGIMSKEDCSRGIHQKDNSLIMLSTRVQNGDKVDWYPEFALVEKVDMFHQQQRIKSFLSSSPVIAEEAKKLKKELVLVQYTVKLRKRKKKIVDRTCFLEPLTSLVTVMRQLNAMMLLPKNPLCNDILNPGKNTSVFSEKAAISPKNNKELSNYNLSQKQAICTASTIAKLEPIQKRVCLLQGPPGTGKSHTIIGIIKKIMRDTEFKSHIILCAPSNGAVDELLKRLKKTKQNFENAGQVFPLSVVRVGSFMNPELIGYSIGEQLKQKKKKKLEQSVLPSIRNEMERLRASTKQLREWLRSGGYDSKKKADLNKMERKLNEMESKYLNTKQVTLSNDEEWRMEYDILKNANVICGTLNSMGRHRLQTMLIGKLETRQDNIPEALSFNCIIIDEATQSTEVDCLIPLMYKCNKLIMVGDPEQLPPTVLSKEAADKEFGLSLFERIYNHFKQTDSNPVLLLDTQYRMDPEITNFPSEYVYDGRLQTDSSVINRCTTFRLKPYILYDLLEGQEQSHKSGAISNPVEAEFTSKLCTFLVINMKIKVGDIGIIAPYQEQKSLLLDALGNLKIEVGTVDGFQGREKEVIILSCVRARSTTGGIGFLNNRKRMNVALTRAKYALYVIGHLDSLKTGGDWRRLIENGSRRNVIYQVQNRHSIDSAIRYCVKDSAR